VKTVQVLGCFLKEEVQLGVHARLLAFYNLHRHVRDCEPRQMRSATMTLANWVFS